MTINELYKLIEQGIKDAIDDEWERAELNIETASNNSVLLKGQYFNKDKRKSLKFDKFYKEELELFEESILKLKRIMSDISYKNRWNKAVFTASVNGTFESKFSWDNKLSLMQSV